MASQALVEPFHQDPLSSAIANIDELPTKHAHLILSVDSSPPSHDAPSAQVDTVAEELPSLSDNHLLPNTVQDSDHSSSNQSADVAVVCVDVTLPAAFPDSDGDNHLNGTSAVHVAMVTQEDEDAASLDPGSISFLIPRHLLKSILESQDIWKITVMMWMMTYFIQLLGMKGRAVF